MYILEKSCHIKKTYLILPLTKSYVATESLGDHSLEKKNRNHSLGKNNCSNEYMHKTI